MNKSPKYIKKLIAKGQERQAINLMIRLSKDVCPSIYNDSILLSYQYEKAVKSLTLGLESASSPILNKIVNGALVVTDDLIKKNPAVYVTEYKLEKITDAKINLQLGLGQ